MASASDHAVKLVKGLNRLRVQKELCDITIKVGKRSFDAHKNVLAADSKYFESMFKRGSFFKESTQKEIEIDGKPEIFEKLLKYIYTGKLEITSDTMFDILEMTCYMQLTNAAEECGNFMKAKFDSLRRAKHTRYYWQRNEEVEASDEIATEDVFKICLLANHGGLKQLSSEADKYLCENFQELKSLDVFLETASYDFLEQFLKRKELSSADEEKEVLEMIVKWLKHDWKGRRKHAPNLLRQVRLGLVPEETLTQLLDATFQAVPECKRLYQEAVEELNSGRSWSDLARQIPHLFATRSTITAPIALSSGEESKDTEDNKFYYYDVGEHKWKKLGSFNCFDYSTTFMIAGGNLYAVGGIFKTPMFWLIDMPPSRGKKDEYEGIKRMDFHCPEDEFNFLQYNDKSNRWDELPGMSSRHNCSPVYLDGSIYAIGGDHDPVDRSGTVSEVTRYNIEKREWTDVASLPDAYRGQEVSSAMEYQGKILVYVVGTRGSMIISGKQAVLVYDPSTDVWQTKLTENRGQMSRSDPTPILFRHNDVCYKVTSFVPREMLYDYNKDVRCRPTVNILDIGKDVQTISVGEEMSQDLIPQNTVGAFRIQNEVFINVKGSVIKTDLKIRNGQKGNVNLGKWKNLGLLKNRQSNIVNYTFDKKKCLDDDDY